MKDKERIIDETFVGYKLPPSVRPKKRGSRSSLTDVGWAMDYYEVSRYHAKNRLKRFYDAFTLDFWMPLWEVMEYTGLSRRGWQMWADTFCSMRPLKKRRGGEYPYSYARAYLEQKGDRLEKYRRPVYSIWSDDEEQMREIVKTGALVYCNEGADGIIQAVRWGQNVLGDQPSHTKVIRGRECRMEKDGLRLFWTLRGGFPGEKVFKYRFPNLYGGIGNCWEMIDKLRKKGFGIGEKVLTDDFTSRILSCADVPNVAVMYAR